MEDSRTDSFVFFRSYYNSILRLKDDSARMELLKCICEYAFNGELYESKLDYVNAIFESHRFNIDKSIENRKINQINGSKGGAPKGNQNARKQPKTTEINLNENVDVNGNVYVNEYADGNENEKENVYVHGNSNENEIVKSKRRGRTKPYDFRTLKDSELDIIFSSENINVVSKYYTDLKKRDFESFTSNQTISSIEDLKEDFERYKRSMSIE